MGEGGNSEDLPLHELAGVWVWCLNPKKFWQRNVGNLSESVMLGNLPLPLFHALTFGSMERSQSYLLTVHTLLHTRYAVYFYGTFQGFT